MQYLSSQQALADYAVLLRALKRELGPGGDAVPAIAFGGSYGGVLSAMFRSKYPGSVAGAIAASAPLRAFPTQLPAWDSGAYYARVTATASPAGGCPAACADNVRSLWAPLFADAASDAGRARLSAAFRTCAPLQTPDDGLALAFWVRSAFDVLAMGNYPYPSSYIAPNMDGYPMRTACAQLAQPQPQPGPLYEAVRNAVGVLYNASGSGGDCFAIPPNPYTHPADPYDGIWDWQQCAGLPSHTWGLRHGFDALTPLPHQLYAPSPPSTLRLLNAAGTEWQPDSQWFSTDGVADMFWPLARNESFMAEHCAAAWAVNVTEQSKGWMASTR